MPVSQRLAEQLAHETADLYLAAERDILARIARSLSEGLDAPDWAERKLAELQLLRAHTERTISGVERLMPGMVDKAIRTAWNRGSAIAAADLARLLGGVVEDYVDVIPGRRALDALVRETVGMLGSTHPRILRVTLDAYRDVVAKTSGQVLLGTMTRRDVAQRVLNEFAKRGVTGFIDKAGRSWDLASYTEMATRTTVGQSYLEGHFDRLREYDVDLVVVSDNPEECDLCRPWEGRVLSLSGATAGVIPGHDGRERVAGSVEQARAAGLWHPNCSHVVSAFAPGETRSFTDTANPQGYEDRQQLRYLERQTRAWKRREAAALSPEERQRAAARVRDYQARIKAHTDTTDQRRRRDREQISTAR